MSDAENVPMDATAMQANQIVMAAIAWRYKVGPDPLLTESEWRLYEACNQYGDKYKGLSAR